MDTQAYTELTGPNVWVGPEIQNDINWIHNLSAESIEDLDKALHHVQTVDAKIPFEKSDFPLTVMATELKPIIEDICNGRGFAIIRGIPRDKYTDKECELIYWGLGIHIGGPVSQNARGHLLGHVLDEGRDSNDPMARNYQTAQRMDFHCDLLPVDVLGLFCLRQAKSGGASSLVSSMTVHNILLKERPDLLDVLYQPFYMDWRGEEPEGELPWFSIPMYSNNNGYISSRFASRNYHESCSRFGTEYSMTDRQGEALDVVQGIANRPELRLSMRMEDGDIQLLNNHVTMHGRDAFEDHKNTDRQRHLLRMWIGLPEDQRRPLSSAIDGRYALVKSGGIPIKEVAQK
jgi:hypothetical protein